jgi:SSS family solute:Na+ symporter
MPVLAAFIVAIFVRGANARALRWAMLFGVSLYTVFTFVWTPLHYLHLMFITLLATIAFAVIGSRLMARPAAVVAPEAG